MMPDGFGVSLRELAWWSLNVLHQQRPNQSEFFKSRLFRTDMSNKATVELLRQMDQTSLCVVLTWFVSLFLGVLATASTLSLIRRRAAMMHRAVHFFLRVSVSAVSFSGCSSVPAPSACLLRLTGAGASRCSCTTRPPVETERPWFSLMRSPSLHPGSARPHLTTKTCSRVTEYVGPRACVRACVF